MESTLLDKPMDREKEEKQVYMPSLYYYLDFQLLLRLFHTPIWEYHNRWRSETTPETVRALVSIYRELREISTHDWGGQHFYLSFKA